MKSMQQVLLKLVVGAVISAVAMAIISAIVLNTILLPRLDVMLADAMRRELSLPDNAAVIIKRGTLRETLHGHLPASLIESSAAVIEDLPVENVYFRTSKVDFNMRRIIRGEKAEITSVGTAELTLRVSADELRARLVQAIEKQGMTDVRIEFGTDSVKVTAENDAQTKLSATGRFYLVDDNRVGFALTDVELDLINIEVSNLVLPVDDILPPLDLGGMFARIVIDEIKVSGTHMDISAHTEVIGSDQLSDDAIEIN